MAKVDVDAICMGPTGNLQGSYKVVYLRYYVEDIPATVYAMLPMTKTVIQCIHKTAHMEGQPNLLDLKFTAGNGEITDANDVAYGVTDPAMAGVHGYNSAQQVIDSPNMPDLIVVDSDDGRDDLIPPSLTEPFYGDADVWTYDIDDSEARSAPSVKSVYSRSVPSSGREDSLILTWMTRVH